MSTVRFIIVRDEEKSKFDFLHGLIFEVGSMSCDFAARMTSGTLLLLRILIA